MNREKVYIAGKITGLPWVKVVKKFRYWKDMLERLGYEVISPIEIVPPDASWDEAMLICLAYLYQCDKALFTKDWVFSKGASIEFERCIDWEIPVLSRGFVEQLAHEFYY